MTQETLVVRSEKTSLDALLWRRYRREVPGLVEQTLARNPGLADMGAFLAVGARVIVDAPAPRATLAPPALVRLYD